MQKIRKDPVDRLKEKKKSKSTPQNEGKWPPEKRSYKGIRKKVQAARLKKMYQESQDKYSDLVFTDLIDARCLEKEAEPLLKPLDPVEVTTGNEVLPQNFDNTYTEYIKDTLIEDPNQIHLDASLRRMELAADALVLETAIDASESINARNSLEKMLAHQMAACHSMAMRLLAKAQSIVTDTAEIQRLVNASARLMNTYQQAYHTIHKMRTGGRQIVTVQHVNVSDGGQAMVAGNITGGDRDNSGGDKE